MEIFGNAGFSDSGTILLIGVCMGSAAGLVIVLQNAAYADGFDRLIVCMTAILKHEEIPDGDADG